MEVATTTASLVDRGTAHFAFAMAQLMSCARRCVGVHFPGDVLAGLPIGSAVTLRGRRQLEIKPTKMNNGTNRSRRHLPLPDCDPTRADA